MREQHNADIENLEGQNRQLREQHDADVKAQKELQSALRLVEDRIRNLIELEAERRKRYEEVQRNLGDALLERDELQRRLTDTNEQKLRLEGLSNERLGDLKEKYRQRGEQLTIEQNNGAALQQALQTADQLAARLQSGYDEIGKEVKDLKASKAELQKGLAEEQMAHTGTKAGYTEVDKRIGAADRDAHSARQEFNQLTAEHATGQLRIEQLQRKVEKLTAIRIVKDRLETENHNLQEERTHWTAELEAKQKHIEVLEAQVRDQPILSNATVQREAFDKRTIDDQRETIALLQRPRVWEQRLERKRNVIVAMKHLATSLNEDLSSEQDDKGRQKRKTKDQFSIPSEADPDSGDEPAHMPHFKKPKLGYAEASNEQVRQKGKLKDVPRRSVSTPGGKDGSSDDDAEQDEEDEEATMDNEDAAEEAGELDKEASRRPEERTGGFPDAVLSTDCVIASLSQLQNGTDGTALPAEVKKRFHNDIKRWNKRSSIWASHLQPNNGNVRCCDHVVQRHPCQWCKDGDGLPNYYRACGQCARNGRVCAILTNVDTILFLPLTDEDRERFSPDRRSFVKEDVAYWVREDKGT